MSRRNGRVDFQHRNARAKTDSGSEAGMTDSVVKALMAPDFSVRKKCSGRYFSTDNSDWNAAAASSVRHHEKKELSPAAAVGQQEMRSGQMTVAVLASPSKLNQNRTAGQRKPEGNSTRADLAPACPDLARTPAASPRVTRLNPVASHVDCKCSGVRLKVGWYASASRPAESAQVSFQERCSGLKAFLV